MPKYTKTEFAKYLGISHAILSVAINRDKTVIVTGDYIDDSEPKNKAFILKKLMKAQQKAKNGNDAIVVVPENKTNVLPMDNNLGKIVDLNEKKLLRQVEHLEVKIKTEEARANKLLELVIPREHASFLIRNYATGIEDVWKTATERFLMQTGIAIGLTKEEIIKHKKDMVDIINDAVKTGAEKAERNIRKLSAEFSGKKGRGERDEV